MMRSESLLQFTVSHDVLLHGNNFYNRSNIPVHLAFVILIKARVNCGAFRFGIYTSRDVHRADISIHNITADCTDIGLFITEASAERFRHISNRLRHEPGTILVFSSQAFAACIFYRSSMSCQASVVCVCVMSLRVMARVWHVARRPRGDIVACMSAASCELRLARMPPDRLRLTAVKSLHNTLRTRRSIVPSSQRSDAPKEYSNH